MKVTTFSCKMVGPAVVAGIGSSERGFKRHMFSETRSKKKILELQVATTFYSAGCRWQMVLICSKRKILLIGCCLVVDTDLV